MRSKPITLISAATKRIDPAAHNVIAFFGAGYNNREKRRAVRFGRDPFTPLERWRRRNARSTRRSLDIDAGHLPLTRPSARALRQGIADAKAGRVYALDGTP